MNTTLVVFLIIIGLAALIGLAFVVFNRGDKAQLKAQAEQIANLKVELDAAETQEDTYRAALIEIAQGNTAWQSIAFEALHPTTKKEIH